jgi:hypothetical protein
MLLFYKARKTKTTKKRRKVWSTNSSGAGTLIQRFTKCSSGTLYIVRKISPATYIPNTFVLPELNADKRYCSCYKKKSDPHTCFLFNTLCTACIIWGQLNPKASHSSLGSPDSPKRSFIPTISTGTGKRWASISQSALPMPPAT